MRTTVTVIGDELGGNHRYRWAVMWTDIAQRYLVPITDVNWDIYGFQSRTGAQCRPEILAAAFPNNAPARNTILQVAEERGYVDVGFIPSAFPGVPASTLETYFVLPTLFLFKDVDLTGWWSADDVMVSRRSAGPPLPVVDADIQAPWFKGASTPYVPAPFEPGEHYASTLAPDGTGRIRFTIRTAAARAIVLPFVTGPYARNQSLEVRDAATDRVIWARTPVEFSNSRSVAVVRLPEGTDSIVLEATDGGREADEWLGVAIPRRVSD